jgi:hypothetical protein
MVLNAPAARYPLTEKFDNLPSGWQGTGCNSIN